MRIPTRLTCVTPSVPCGDERTSAQTTAYCSPGAASSGTTMCTVGSAWPPAGCSRCAAKRRSTWTARSVCAHPRRGTRRGRSRPRRHRARRAPRNRSCSRPRCGDGWSYRGQDDRRCTATPGCRRACRRGCPRAGCRCRRPMLRGAKEGPLLQPASARRIPRQRRRRRGNNERAARRGRMRASRPPTGAVTRVFGTTQPSA